MSPSATLPYSVQHDIFSDADLDPTFSFPKKMTPVAAAPVKTGAVSKGGDVTHPQPPRTEEGELQQQQQQHHQTEHRTRPRTMTSLEEIDHNLTRPGSVKINVKGAFIVDPDASTPALGANGRTSGRVSPTHHETSDIRLPNHTAVVSHIAVDV